MKSKDVTVGMKVKVHDITWPGTNATFEQWFTQSGRKTIYQVLGWKTRERCWYLESCSGQGWLLAMSRDFEPYAEEQ